jgi:hypothetical protein
VSSPVIESSAELMIPTGRPPAPCKTWKCGATSEGGSAGALHALA